MLFLILVGKIINKGPVTVGNLNMELFWYVVLMCMLAIYVVLDGYDFGAGIVHLFFATKEKDKRPLPMLLVRFGMPMKSGSLLLEVYFSLLSLPYMPLLSVDFICR